MFGIYALAIDDNGHAFAADFEIVTEDLQPGEEYVVDDLFRRFEGQASTMRVIVDFEFP